jgi:hypothetical protein
MALSGCASTTYRGYPGGSIKYSAIRYDYTARPVLTEPESKTYRLVTDGSFSGVTAVSALEQRGVRRAEGGADVEFSVKAAGPIQHEPGSFGLGGSYQPALISTMPIEISVTDKTGQVILQRTLKHEEYLGLPGAPKFKTREEAKAAMTSISAMGTAGAEKKVREGAPQTVAKEFQLIAKSLFEERRISVTLPAIRSAGDVDMEAAYKMLAEAKSAEQVNDALAAYADLGLEHEKAEGGKDVVAIYGVLCGLASAKILSGDLAGAWQDTKAAWKEMPEGEEHRLIARVLHQQQEQAGVEIIPKEEFDEMVNHDRKQAMEQLNKLFGGGKSK